MADIFAGTQPPQWLVDETRQIPGELGAIGGTAFGGLLNSIQQDPSTNADKVKNDLTKKRDAALEKGDKKTADAIDQTIAAANKSGASALDPSTGQPLGWFGSRKGVAEGLAEARLNIQDPLWRLNVARTQAGILGVMAQTQSALALAEERKAETAAWMQDAPNLSPWLSATPEQRQKMPEPVANSKAGISAIQRSRDADTRYFNQQDANAIRQQNADNASTAAKAAATNTKSFYEMLKTVTNGEDQARILGLTKGGQPTPEAWEALTRAPRQTVEQEKQAGREKLEAQKQEGRVELKDVEAANKEEFEQQRQKDRLELKKVEGDLKVDLEKMRLGAKDGKGRVISEDEYVNRHFNTLFTAAWKESDTKDIRRITQQVEKTLRLRYQTEHKEAPKGPDKQSSVAPPADSTAAATPAVADASTNAAKKTMEFVPGRDDAKASTLPFNPETDKAKALKLGGTNDISYDDFQNWMKGK